MRHRMARLLAAAATIALLAACSKPASQARSDAVNGAGEATASAADTAANATGGATTSGGAVSPASAPENSAINPDRNQNESTQTPGSNSFTQSQAKGHIENAGYAEVSGLTKTPDGMWVGKAKKGGQTVDVSVDFKGAVSAK